jgi:hypothetical protein
MAPEANPEFEDIMQQHGLNRDQQPAPGAAAGDVDMQDTEQQENIPPAGGSQQQQQQSQGGDKQQSGEKQQSEGGSGSAPQTQTQTRKTTTISAEKYEFVKVSCCAVLC